MFNKTYIRAINNLIIIKSRGYLNLINIWALIFYKKADFYMGDKFLYLYITLFRN